MLLIPMSRGNNSLKKKKTTQQHTKYSTWAFPRIGVTPKSSNVVGFFRYKPSIVGDWSPIFVFQHPQNNKHRPQNPLKWSHDYWPYGMPRHWNDCSYGWRNRNYQAWIPDQDRQWWNSTTPLCSCRNSLRSNPAAFEKPLKFEIGNWRFAVSGNKEIPRLGHTLLNFKMDTGNYQEQL